ncbi:dpy-30 domain-containing protein [Botrytis cinerea]
MSQPNTPSPEINPNSTPSISSAAHTYQLAMQTQSSSTPPSSTPSGVLQMPGATRDVVMEDAPLQRPARLQFSHPLLKLNHKRILIHPFYPLASSFHFIYEHKSRNCFPAPVPARTSTPVPKVNGNAEKENSSRATSQHPDTGPSVPTEASVHGAPARVYLNQTVTGSLLEGMKLLAKDQPKDPLRVLGEFLLSKSKELEGGN